MKTVAPGLFMALVVAVSAAAAVLTVRSPSYTDGSFKAFYCAGKAIALHRDPYLVEPLRSCEHAMQHTGQLPRAYVEPAPLPGFALAFFAVLARAPVRVAAAIFAGLILLAVIATALLLAPIARVPVGAVFAVLIPLGWLNLAFGEIPPFATLALCAAAYAIATQRPAGAGIASALALVEPHVGLPAAAAVAILVPGSRVAMLCTILGLAAISVATLGIGGNLEYARAVLPAQAFSELVAADQYSLSRLLHAAGAGDRAALRAGEISYGIMAVSGIVLGSRAARAWNAPSLIVLAPAAAVLLGGVFMHDIQMIAALPAALVTARFVPRARLLLAMAMLVLLSVVWTQHLRASIAVLDLIAVAGAGAVVFGLTPRSFLPAASAAALVVVALFAIGRLEPVARATQIRSAPFSASGNELASIAWARYERSTPALMVPRYDQQIPTWAGLIVLLVCIANAGGSRSGRERRKKTGEDMFLRLEHVDRREPVR